MKFSTNVYDVSNINLIGVPLGWDRFSWQPDKASGFSAGAIGLAVPSRKIFEAVNFYFATKAAVLFCNQILTGNLDAKVSLRIIQSGVQK